MFYRAPASMSFGFADNVQIRSSPATEEAGVAGLAGEVYGWTTPSVTGVDVIGGAPDDTAMNVFVSEREENYWLNPELVELVDVGAGATMTIGSKSFIKTEKGDWKEVSEEQPTPSNVFIRALRSLLGR